MIDPAEVELKLTDRGDGPAQLELVERFTDADADELGELYAELLGPGAEVHVEERDGEAVVRAGVEGGERDVALTLAAATSLNLVQRAGGIDHLRRQLAQLDAGDDARGFQ